jgi:3-methylcrotonyl-CoA carboxylase alpha subunit
MFDKILIANRGEIALRIVRACREMGIASVAVHSTADSDAMHVRMADESVCIGPPASIDSYLSMPAIISACEITGAQAIHPGYGFLSENAGFVQMVEDHGITFIGPSAEHIRIMGDKITAKETAKSLGIPVGPGSDVGVPDVAAAKTVAAKIGYPVIIKATAGGGGRGMKVALDESQLETAFRTARSEAKAAFGNDEVYIEKYLQRPRHIEIQVFGDGRGRAVHLGERDCSLQRRHQKVIEEAPAPGMTPQMRAAMGEAAVRAARAIGYAGAGTVEFIADASEGLRPDRFWFMEMNTRLQVEHPVTEAITGIDLVEWQLRISSGEPLPARQDQIAIRGHAFEARLYAEDVPAGFLPATGRLAHLRFPDHARVETGVRQGDRISPWYDPMIAKIISHGPTRATALRALDAALATTEVAGTVTNLDFLLALSRHDGFARGEVDTGLIARDLDQLLAATADPGATALAALGLAGLHRLDQAQGFALWQPLCHTITWQGGSARLELPGPGHARVTIDSTTHEIIQQDGRWWLDGRQVPARVVTHAGGTSCFGLGPAVTLVPLDPLARGGDPGRGGGLTLSPMPGLVKAVFVVPGQEVAAGDRLAILEAMKMEHNLTAARAGRVAEVLAAPGDQVEAGAALIRLEETP